MKKHLIYYLSNKKLRNPLDAFLGLVLTYTVKVTKFLIPGLRFLALSRVHSAIFSRHTGRKIELLQAGKSKH